MKKRVVPFLLALLIGLPLVGILAAGKSISQYCEFPPLTQYVSHAPFSWVVFTLLAVFGVFIGLLLLGQVRGKTPSKQSRSKAYHLYHFPWWAMAGLILMVVSWILAWNRFSWFVSLQPHTFIPLWLGYILIINGLTFLRSGRCLLTERTLYFLSLFPVSSLFWWFFEYLNRFVQNWYYVGVEGMNGIEYVLHASLAFSTVLPAVLSTEKLFSTFPQLTGPLKSSYIIRCETLRPPIFIIVLFSGAGLAGIGIWPDYLFPALWLSPLVLVVTVQKLSGISTFIDSIGVGDWRPVWLPALAALFCGFFWEMWNVNSYAHWVYSIPFVDTAHVFEMPILGFLGYLPFGLECMGVATLVDYFSSDEKSGQVF